MKTYDSIPRTYTYKYHYIFVCNNFSCNTILCHQGQLSLHQDGENYRRQNLSSCPLPCEVEEESEASSPAGEAWRRGKVSTQANGHTTVNIMTLTGRLAGTLPPGRQRSQLPHPLLSD